MRLSPDEMKRLLAEASRENAGTFSLEEVEDAARAAGIEPEQLERARERLAERDGRAHGIGVVGAVAAGVILLATLLLAPFARPHGDGKLVVHNESRDVYAVEVLVPSHCGRAFETTADDWCSLKTLRLEPHMRERVPVPANACQRVWVRTYQYDQLRHSAAFTLPAGIEIERSGRLDQKGIGAPSMAAAPQPAERVRPVCGGAA